jgi:hypothetical protein
MCSPMAITRPCLTVFRSVVIRIHLQHWKAGLELLRGPCLAIWDFAECQR